MRLAETARAHQPDDPAVTEMLLPEPKLLSSDDPQLCRSVVWASHLMRPSLPALPVMYTGTCWPGFKVASRALSELLVFKS